MSICCTARTSILKHAVPCLQGWLCCQPSCCRLHNDPGVLHHYGESHTLISMLLSTGILAIARLSVVPCCAAICTRQGVLHLISADLLPADDVDYIWSGVGLTHAGFH